jgi:polyisoprenoid-binding protein YceI
MSVAAHIRRFRLLALLAGAAMPIGAGAQVPVSPGSIVSGVLSFDGRATLGDFTGTTTTVTGEFYGGPDLASVQGWVEAPVRTLRTGKGKRDTDMNKSMESDKYPMIRYELTGVTPGVWSGDTAQVTLLGRFVIHGVTREAEIPARLTISGGQVRVEGSTPLNLKDYRIGGLTKFLGTIRMHEDIVVRLDVTFAPAP